LLGIAFALAQNDFKRLLAYCSVENMGVILIGVGGALLAVTHGDAPWGRLAMAGALLHVWNHGAFNPVVLRCRAPCCTPRARARVGRLGGLWRTMPWAAGLLRGSVAVSACPAQRVLVVMAGVSRHSVRARGQPRGRLPARHAGDGRRRRDGEFREGRAMISSAPRAGGGARMPGDWMRGRCWGWRGVAL
jgi:hypothetical protein